MNKNWDENIVTFKPIVYLYFIHLTLKKNTTQLSCFKIFLNAVLIEYIDLSQLKFRIYVSPYVILDLIHGF